LLGKVSSVALKLWLITAARWLSITNFSAVTISGKPVTPSSSEVGVSTSRMFAFGAIACAHSTSRLVSPAHPTRLPSFGSYGGTAPAGWMTVSFGAGKP
jgi:hypothetical protein